MLNWFKFNLHFFEVLLVFMSLLLLFILVRQKTDYHTKSSLHIMFHSNKPTKKLKILIQRLLIQWRKNRKSAASFSYMCVYYIHAHCVSGNHFREELH